MCAEKRNVDCFTLIATALILIAVTACSVENQAAEQGLTTEILSTPTVSAQMPTLAPTSAITPTQPGPITLVTWWPDSVAPVENSAATETRVAQIESFETMQGNVIIQVRLKQENDLGSIMSTLRTASAVAPGALPDLTLIRRDDLLDAAQGGLIYPLEGKIASAILGDLYDVALQLGQVDGQLYGLPYLLDAQHIAYHAGASIPARFETFLSEKLSFAFPAAEANRISSVFLTQYLAAGGTLPVNNVMTINESALLNTLTFYERAAAEGVVDASILNYTTSAEYQVDLLSGVIDVGLVTSKNYLDLTQAGENLEFGTIPTEAGQIVGEVNGWMWVLTTSSADRQALAVRFLNWLLNAARQGQYSQTVHYLPSQRTALQEWGDTPYLTFVNTLLMNATPPLSDIAGGTTARAMQGAFVSVLMGQSSAEQATQAVMSQVAG
jgi:ABC-type glycerol-3-phosphate transport system substrate-binding protein